ADSRLALLLEGRPGGEREFVAAHPVELLDLGDPKLLVRVTADELLELADLEAGELPVAGVDVAVRFDLLIQHEAGERGLRARDVRADVPDDQRDVIGVPLSRQRLLARAIGGCNQPHHREQDESRDQTGGGSTPAPPVEADVVPIPDHRTQCSPVNHLAKAKGSPDFADSTQLMQPVARPAAANVLRAPSIAMTARM